MSSVANIYEKQRLFFNSNKTKSVGYRKRKLIELKNTLVKRETDILSAINKDLGKHFYESYLTEYFMIISEIKKTIKNINFWTKPQRVKPSILNFPSRDYLLSDPYGCTLQISPWNYPFQLSMATLIGSIAAGNTIVLKPSEYAPKTSEIISEIISSVFEEGHVKAITGGPKVATELLKLRWDHIIFTGSTKIGKIIAAAAAKHLTPTILELGGKSPCIVDQTAKIKVSSKRIAWAKFINCGQTCIAPDYILVHNQIKEKLIEGLSSEIRNLYGNKAIDSKSYGKIAHIKHFERMIEFISGEKILFGGDHDKESLYFGPTIIEIQNSKSKLMKSEIFGPILPIISFSNEEELREIILENEKPLGFYIFSEKRDFIRKMSRYFSFGGGVSNDCIIQFVNNNLPFGGVGHSGMGKYHGKYSFDAFTHYKPFIERGTWIDIPLRYAPYPSSFKWLKKVLNYFT